MGAASWCRHMMPRSYKVFMGARWQAPCVMYHGSAGWRDDALSGDMVVWQDGTLSGDMAPGTWHLCDIKYQP